MKADIQTLESKLGLTQDAMSVLRLSLHYVSEACLFHKVTDGDKCCPGMFHTPIPGVLMKRGNLNTEPLSIVRRPCRDMWRRWSYTPVNHQVSNIAKKPPEAGREA